MVAETVETEITVAEAAAFAGVSDRTIRNWINEGDLEARNTPVGRKVRKDAVVELLRAKGYAPPELETIINLADARQEREQRVSHEAEEETTPEPPEVGLNGAHQTTGGLTPETINIILQPLVEQLNAANARVERKEKENLELAGRVGYLQAKVQQYEERVLLLEAPKEVPAPERGPEPLPLTQPPTAAPEPIQPEPARLPWYKRLFSPE